MDITTRTTQALRGVLYYSAVITMLSYFLRDAFTAVVRYYLDMVGLGLIWFAPDILGFYVVSLFVFVVCIREINLLAVFFVAASWFSIVVSCFYFQGYLISIFSAIKMFLPLLVGFCFRDRSLFDARGVKTVFVIAFFITTLSIALNPYVEYPWLGFETTNAFGVTREAQRLWWNGGVIRYGGFAGDSTMAAFVTLFTYIAISQFTPLLFNVLSWPLVAWALYNTNSRTSLGIFVLFICVYSIVKIFPRKNRLHLMRRITQISFICILIPPIFLLLLGGMDLTEFSSDLTSLADRINNTWFGPFPLVSDLFPIGLFIGCGLGCYAYPQLYYDVLAPFHLPLDNFYLTTFLEMGYPFLFFVVVLFLKVRHMKDRIKLMSLMAWNVWAVTVQGYGPSYATLLFGYAVSEIFAPQDRYKGGIRIPMTSIPRQPPGDQANVGDHVPRLG